MKKNDCIVTDKDIHVVLLPKEPPIKTMDKILCPLRKTKFIMSSDENEDAVVFKSCKLFFDVDECVGENICPIFNCGGYNEED
jgi:hypothetical protein